MPITLFRIEAAAVAASGPACIPLTPPGAEVFPELSPFHRRRPWRNNPGSHRQSEKHRPAAASPNFAGGPPSCSETKFLALIEPRCPWVAEESEGMSARLSERPSREFYAGIPRVSATAVPAHKLISHGVSPHRGASLTIT